MLYMIQPQKPLSPDSKKLQTRVAKLISGSGPRANRKPIYKSLDCLSLQNRRDIHNVYWCTNG